MKEKVLIMLLVMISLVACTPEESPITNIQDDDNNTQTEIFSLTINDFYGKTDSTVPYDSQTFFPNFPENVTVLFYAAETKGKFKKGQFVSKREMNIGVNTFDGLPTMKYDIYATNYYMSEKDLENWVIIENPINELPSASTNIYVFGKIQNVDYSTSTSASIEVENPYGCLQMSSNNPYEDRPYVTNMAGDIIPFIDTNDNTWYMYLKNGTLVNVPTRKTQQGAYTIKPLITSSISNKMAFGTFNTGNDTFEFIYFPLAKFKLK